MIHRRLAMPLLRLTSEAHRDSTRDMWRMGWFISACVPLIFIQATGENKNLKKMVFVFGTPGSAQGLSLVLGVTPGDV